MSKWACPQADRREALVGADLQNLAAGTSDYVLAFVPEDALCSQIPESDGLLRAYGVGTYGRVVQGVWTDSGETGCRTGPSGAYSDKYTIIRLDFLHSLTDGTAVH